MQIKIENLKEKCEIHFSATVEGDEWKDAQQKAMVDLAKNVTVKGFRKGKAPLAQAIRQIPARDIMDKAADKAVQKAYNEMIEKNNIRPFMQPELIVNDFKADKLSFTFVVLMLPEVTLGEYKGITIEKKEVSVTDKDIDDELNSLANKNAEMVVAELDATAENGDTVVIDFKGYVDGEAFDGGEASSFEIELGYNVFVPGFESQLVGVKTNDDKDVVITFPENYVANLAGKEATFKVHVNSIKKKVVPAIDDDLAKDLDIEGVDTLEQLKEHLKKQISERKKNQNEQDAFNALFDKVNENATFSCHEKILKEDANRIVKDFEARLSQQGFDVDDYLKMTGKTRENLDAEAMEEARKNTKKAYIFEKIAEVENITVTDEEIDAKLDEIAKQYNQTLEDIKKQLGNRINSFAFNMKQEKVIDFLKNNNNI